VHLGVERLAFPVEVVELRGGELLPRNGYSIRAIRVDHRVNALGYAIEEHTRPGRFDPSAAAALGVPSGPLFGQLQKGQSVTLSDGSVVSPAQVMGEARPGRKVVISGDTRPCAALRDAAKDADLLIHEATFSDEEQERALETRHSTGREAGRIAREAAVKRLVLTHFSSRHDVDPRPLVEQARQEYAGQVDAAFDGFSVELPLRVERHASDPTP
jgi:ribonuclease Z